MSSAVSLTAPPAARAWVRRLVLVAAIAAVGGQLWGLYRTSGPPTTPWFPDIDKVEHALGFAVPVFLILTTRRLAGFAVTRSAMLVVAAVFVAHAMVSELIQGRFYRYRTGDPRDAVADTIGVALGSAAFWALDRRLSGREAR